MGSGQRKLISKRYFESIAYLRQVLYMHVGRRHRRQAADAYFCLQARIAICEVQVLEIARDTLLRPAPGYRSPIPAEQDLLAT